MGTAYLHFFLLGKLLYVFQNTAEMKIAIFIKRILNLVYLYFLHTPYISNKATVFYLHMACIKLSMPPGGFPSALLKSYSLLFHNWEDS